MPSSASMEYKINEAKFGTHEVIWTNTKILTNPLYQTPL